MFGYRLHLADGSDVCDATYAVVIYPREEIIAGDNEHFRVLTLLPLEDEWCSPYRATPSVATMLPRRLLRPNSREADAPRARFRGGLARGWRTGLEPATTGTTTRSSTN
jgi:hypothetical protein